MKLEKRKLGVLTCGVLALTVGLFLAFDSRSVEMTDPRIQVVGDRVFLEGQPFSGRLVERNLNHDLLERSEYREGQKDGESSRYHHNGARILRSHYRLGKKDGRQDTWYPDGKHRSTSSFANGVAEGTYTEWHPNGKIYRQQTIKDGIEIDNKMFYESGVIYSNYTVREKRTYGIQGEPLCRASKQEGFK